MEPKQRTPEGPERDAVDLPGEGGVEIPVPEREDVLAALRKVAKPRPIERDAESDE